MRTEAVVFDTPGSVALRSLDLDAPGPADVVVETLWSGISTGTEKLLWSGRMPPFPGLGYPLVPGYETVGEVVEAGPESGFRAGQRVFVPGATCYGPVRGLFGGTAARLVAKGARLRPVDAALGADACLMALAATAHHAVAGGAALPALVVGPGALGRLIARLGAALGQAPTVWEIAEARMDGAEGYAVIRPEDDPRRDYARILDVSGAGDLLDTLIARLAPGGEVVLAGFYAEPVAFAFPPAFLREASIRVAAEWRPDDLDAVSRLVSDGRLTLAGLLTHGRPAQDAPEAYAQAFEDPACLKMALSWKDT